MKCYECSFTVFLLIFLVGAQCGLIDNIYGKVKDTTSGLTQDVRNVWSYGKRFVGLENKDNENIRPEEEKRGLIGGMVYSAREKVHAVKSYFWNTDEYSNDAGLFGNMFHRVKTRIFKAKGFILGNNSISGNTTELPPNEKTKLIRDTLNKLFFRNGTRNIRGNAFTEAIENLRKKLQEYRNNMTISTTVSPVHHGEGLIDVRSASVNIENTINGNTAGVNNDIYDRVDDNINAASNNTTKTYNNVQENADNGLNIMQEGIIKVDALRDKIYDATAKENEMLGTISKKLNGNVIHKTKDTFADMERFSY